MAVPTELMGTWKQLARQSLTSELPGKDLTSYETLTDLQLVRLVQTAAALALERDPDSRREAYEVVARLVEVYGEDLPAGAKVASRLVLARLANFPAIDLFDKRVEFSQNLLGIDNKRIPAAVAFETIGRREENSVDLIDEETAYLTQFQWKVYEAMREGKRVAFSAPTSSGKSYVLGLDLIRRVKERREVVVYVVPTRALIRQVSDGLRNWLAKGKLSHIPLRTTPLPIRKGGDAAGAAFVLTQERFLALLYSPEGRQEIHTVIVDEAHSIGDGSRGILLQTALESLARLRPKAVVHFSAPAIGNPEDFTEWFPSDTPPAHTVEEVGPVTQNIMLVEPVSGKPTMLRFSVLEEGSSVLVGERKFGKVPKGKKDQVAWFAREITKLDQSTIVYCGGPESVKTTAELLAKYGPPIEINNDVKDAVEFLREYVHPAYIVADLLEQGIGMHHGDMPLIVRSVIEDLFQDEHIRFLACTSTLLQGVNLPVRHLVLGATPTRGRKADGSYRTLGRHEFLNLAGRAGRLSKEFQGSVWIFKPEGKWKEYASKEVPRVEPAIRETIRLGQGAVVLEALRDPVVKSKKDRPSPEAMAAASKVLVDALADKRSIRSLQGISEVPEATLLEMEEEVAKQAITLPADVLHRNPGIHPARLQRLHNDISAMDQLGHLTPVDPDIEFETDRFYEHMKEAIRITERILTRNPSDRQYTYYTLLAHRWLRSQTLFVIIKQAVEHEEDKRGRKLNRVEINRVIDKTLEDLEDVVRFRLVRNLRAFNDIITLVLDARGQGEFTKNVKPLHVYLEVGTTKRQILNLISLGLSRGAAIELNRAIPFKADEEPEAYLATLRTYVPLAMLTEPVRDEVRRLLGQPKSARKAAPGA